MKREKIDPNIKILLLVEELHRRGLYGLRIFTQIHQGIAYRIFVFPVNAKREDNTYFSEKSHSYPSKFMKSWSNGIPNYNDFTESWKLQDNWSVEEMAEKFIKDFPEISELSRINNNFL